MHYSKWFKRKHQWGEQRASLKDRHELFTPSDKRGNERDIEKETVREMEMECDDTKKETDR